MGLISNWIENKADKREHENAVKKLVEVIKSQHTSYRKEMKHWLMAKNAAKDPEQPRRKLLMDFIDEVLDDAFIYGRLETRTLRILNKDFNIKVDDEIDDDLKKLFEKSWFRFYIRASHESNYFGYSLPFVNKFDEEGMIKEMDLVFRDHIVPEKCEILKNLYDQKGVDFSQPPYTRTSIFINHKNFLGLLNKIIPLYVFKKHSWQNWDEFEEKFGLPMRIAKTASTDPRVLKEIDKWLKELGSSARARFPVDTELEIKESNSRDAYQVFNEKRKACNEEIGSLIDGHMEATKDTGSRAKADSMIESTQDLITANDAKFVKTSVNEQLIPMLIELGYPLPENTEFEWNENTKLDPKERLEIFKGVKKLGHNVSKDQIKRELDVELEDAPPPDNSNTPPNNRIANFNPPHSVHNCGAHPDDYRLTVYNSNYDLSEDELSLLRAVMKGSVNWNYKEFLHHHQELLKGLREGIGLVDTSFDADGHKMQAIMRTSIHRFGHDKTVAEVWQLNDIVRTSKDFSEVKERALKLFPNYKLHWLKTEYQQAFAASQMGARWQEWVENIDIAPYWKYVSVLDEKVRDSHKALHGKVFRKDDPESAKYLPPIEFNCRCDAEEELDNYDGEVSNFSDAIASDPDLWERMQKTGHDVNWGDAGQVFSSGQSYLRKLRADPINYTDLTPEDFGLAKTFKSSLNFNATRFKWIEKLDDNGLVKLFDLNHAPVWAGAEALENIEPNLINQLSDVLLFPDEVYHLGADQAFQYHYLKHYKEGSIRATVGFSRKQSKLLEDIVIDKQPNNLREGLLTYNKPDAIAFEQRLYNEGQQALDLRSEKGFDTKTGGWYLTEKGHLNNEIALNKSVTDRMITLGHRFVLRTPKSGATYDTLWNDVPFEIKVLEKYSNLANRLKKELQKATKQGLGNALIAINGGYDRNQIIRGILSAINQPKSGDRIKNVSILLPNNKLIRITRAEIKNGTFKKLL